MTREGGSRRGGSGRGGGDRAGGVQRREVAIGKRTLTGDLRSPNPKREASPPLTDEELAVQRKELTASAAGVSEAWRQLHEHWDAQVQQRGDGRAETHDAAGVHEAASVGLATPAQELPHRERLEESFGQDLSGVRAHVGGEAETSAGAMGAEAYASGNDVVLPSNPSLHLVAHEVTHTIQQQHGVQLKGGVGEAGDAHEREADAVADAVVAGESAAPLLARYESRTAPSCSSTIQKQGKKGIDKARYDAIEGRLRTLIAQKRAVVEGQGNLEGIDAEIDALVAALHTDFGVRMDKGKILEAAVADKDMLVVNGRVVVSPSGDEHYMGERLGFALQLDHVPPGEGVQIGWRWRTDPWGGPEYRFLINGPAFAEKTASMDMELDTPFWGLVPPDIEKAKGMQVVAHVYIGDVEKPTTRFYSGYIRLPERPVGDIKIVGAPAKAVVGQYVDLGVGPWTPDFHGHSIDWFVDDKKVAGDQLGLRQQLSKVGTHKVRADVHTVRRSFGVHDKTPLKSAETSVDVMTADQFGTSFLDEAEASPFRPKPVELGKLVATGDESLDEMQERVDQGGSQQAYWEERLKAQKGRLGKIKELAPDHATAKPLPEDPTKLESGSYSGPITAALVMAQNGGAQPLTLHLTIRGQNGGWTTRLIDSTSRKVLKADGAGATPLEAYESAFETWRENNEYPTGGRIVHRFAPTGWSKGHGFDTYTTWKRAKEWVDGILTVGGFVVGALLLADPDPTISKLLGGILMAAVVARSSVAIYERIRDGGDVLSSENVLDAVAIVTSFMGMGGSVLRAVGLKAINPTIYRAGNWMIMGALAGDAGTFVYVSAEAIAQMQAIQGDPTMDDGQRASETLRIMASLFLTGAMLVASNKELLRNGLKPTDFVQGKLERGAKPDLDVGARLDAEYELKQAGKWNKETSKLSDEAVLDQVFTVRSRKEIEAALSKVAKPVDVGALVTEFGDDGVVALAKVLGDTRLANELALAGAKPFIDAKAAFGVPATARLADAVGADGLAVLVADDPKIKLDFEGGTAAAGSYRWGGTGALEGALKKSGGRWKKAPDETSGLRRVVIETSKDPVQVSERGRYGDVKIDPAEMSPKDAAALERLFADFDITEPGVKARIIESIENAQIGNPMLDLAGAIKAEIRPVLKEAQAAAQKETAGGTATTTQDVLAARGKAPLAREAQDPVIAEAQRHIDAGILKDPVFLSARTPGEGRDAINRRRNIATAKDRAEGEHGLAGGKIITNVRFFGDLSIPQADGTVKKRINVDVAPDVDAAYVIDTGGMYAVQYIGGIKIVKPSAARKAAADAAAQNARNVDAIKAGDQPFETVTRRGEKGTAQIRLITAVDDTGTQIDVTGKLTWDAHGKTETIGPADTKEFDAPMAVESKNLDDVVEGIWRLAEIANRR
jgi:hypothetical protein